MNERLVPVHELVTVDDIAKKLGVSVNTAANIVRGRDGKKRIQFPKPLVGVGVRAVWLWSDVADWCKQTAPKDKEDPRTDRTPKYHRHSWRNTA